MLGLIVYTLLTWSEGVQLLQHMQVQRLDLLHVVCNQQYTYITLPIELIKRDATQA